MRTRRLLTAFILSSLLTACMGIKFTYNNLDWLIPWYLDDYVALDKSQNAAFEQQFEQLWLWHRKEELPKYSDLLKALIKDIESGTLDQQRLRHYQQRTSQLYREVAIRGINQGIDLIASLSDEQVDEIAEVIEAQNDDFEAQLADTSQAKRRAKSVKETRQWFKKWLGPLSKKQHQLIEHWGEEIEPSAAFRFEYLKRSRQHFINTLKARSDKKALLQQLLYLVQQREQLHSSEHLAVRERNNQRMLQLLLAIQNNLSDKQKRRLVNKIENYQESFYDLSTDA